MVLEELKNLEAEVTQEIESRCEGLKVLKIKAVFAGDGDIFSMKLHFTKPGIQIKFLFMTHEIDFDQKTIDGYSPAVVFRCVMKKYSK